MKYTIEYVGSVRQDETVEADSYTDTKDGEWIDFWLRKPDGDERVLRVRAQGVARIVTER